MEHLPDFVQTHWKNYNGDVWYKIHWTSNCTQNEEPFGLVISHINMAGKVYLNDNLLWLDASLIEPLSRSWNIPRIWSIPTSAVKTTDNIIWVYVASAAIQDTNLGHVHIGLYDQMLPKFKNYLLKQRTFLEIGFLINIIVAIFYFMMWIIYRKEFSYLWISLSVTCWLSYSLFFLTPWTPFTSIQLDRLLAWCFSTYTLVSCISIWRFANLKFPKIEKVFLLFFFTTTTIFIFVPDTYLKTTIQVFFIINMLIFFLENLTYPFLTYKSKQIEIYLMATVHLLFIPIAVHDAHQIMTYQNEFWSPLVSPLTAIILGVLLCLRLHRNNKLISQFNHTLNNEIKNVTEKLSYSLNHQHKLALDNIRLQERINLSRDLHDGIGGSIVRSIELVSRNEHIGKSNFLSILKVLSSDLRQIIDNGVSLDAKTPNTPILWIAPTRHRFMEIFDELEIEAYWAVQNEWVNPPTAIQCLTLTRIMEEALTNTIKHSQASQVYVNLIQSEQTVTLNIIDNGIGFNSEYITSAAHVGLQSMQIRVQRLQGKLNITSSTEGTRIQVIFFI